MLGQNLEMSIKTRKKKFISTYVRKH